VSIYDDRGDFRLGRILVYCVLAIVALLALIWGIRVLAASTSGAKGTLQIQQQRGTADNREHWSATIKGDYENVQSDQRNIRTAVQAAAGAHATSIDTTNLTGVEMACSNDVAQYNTDAGNALAVIPDGYPDHLDAQQQCASNTTGLQTP
jgi:hypothetical protein